MTGGKNSNRIILFKKCFREYFSKPRRDSAERLLILQCDNGHNNADLIACARHVLWDEYKQSQDSQVVVEYKQSQDDQDENFNFNAHVVFLIQLPRITGGCFVGFQVGL